MQLLLKISIIILLLVSLISSLSAQNWNGGTGDGYDAHESTNFSLPVVSKFNGSTGDGYEEDASISYSATVVSKFNGGTDDGYNSLSGVFLLSDTVLLGGSQIEDGDVACYNAAVYLEVPVGGGTFIINDGGSATLIAGVKICLKEGFRAEEGSYLDAHITLDGSYCNVVVLPQQGIISGKAPGDDDFVFVSDERNEDRIKVYPNPTAAKLTIEHSEDCGKGSFFYEIYDLTGQIVRRIIRSGTSQVIDLSGHLPGIYFIMINNDDKIYRIKVVKL